MFQSYFTDTRVINSISDNRIRKLYVDSCHAHYSNTVLNEVTAGVNTVICRFIPNYTTVDFKRIQEVVASIVGQEKSAIGTSEPIYEYGKNL